MAIRNSTPMPFTPRGLVDAFDATEKFSGACRILQNLIFDQSNPELTVSRPGNITLANLATAGISNPTFISIQQVVGNRVYGMVASSLNAGNDQPFVFDLVANALITVTGITAGNTPTSPSTVGDWTPPTLAVVGTMVIITHPGFSGAVGKFYGVIDITNPAAPAWRTENTTTNLLPSVPVAVANLANRAYFACGNFAIFTDVLTNPLTITNANQALTIGSSDQAINALAGLPVQTFGTGVIQSLTIFKKTQIWKITGDQALANLSVDFLSLNIGTTAPRSIAQGPYGMYFISFGGPYFIDLLGAVRLLTHTLQEQEPDIQAPMQNAVTPTRWAGAYNASVYRVCGPTVINGVQSVNDYWFDEHKRRWNGPHSFAYDCASAYGQTFLLTSVNNPGLFVQSSPNQAAGFPLTDLGATMPFNLTSSSFPKRGDMLTKQVAESQIELSAVNGVVTYTITAQNERGNQIPGSPVNIVAGAAIPRWGTMIWGSFTWTSFQSTVAPNTYPVPWTQPLVFEKMQLVISGNVTATLGIGAFFARYQPTGYMTTGVQ